MKLTARTIGMLAGAIGTLTGAAAGAFAHSRAAGAEPASTSTAALTAGDLERLRQHIDKRFDSQGAAIGALQTSVAGINGYLDAQKQAALERAVTARVR